MNCIPVSRMLEYPSLVGLANYVADGIRNADPGSEFAEKHADIPPDMTPKALIEHALSERYEGLVFTRMDGDFNVVGHVFYQMQGDMAHMFSILVVNGERDNHYATAMAGMFLEHVHDCGVVEFRFGADNAAKKVDEESWKKFEHIRRRVANNELDLPFLIRSLEKKYESPGWMEFAD